MSLPSEKIEAQRRAFYNRNYFSLRHLIGPVELEYLYKCKEELFNLKKQLNHDKPTTQTQQHAQES